MDGLRLVIKNGPMKRVLFIALLVALGSLSATQSPCFLSGISLERLLSGLPISSILWLVWPLFHSGYGWEEQLENTKRSCVL